MILDAQNNTWICFVPLWEVVVVVFQAVNMETLEVDPWISIVDLEVEAADACFILSNAMCRVVAMAT
jgi:hypothetical protein